MNKKKKDNGFTLIETLIYSLLFTLVLGSIIFFVYVVIVSGDKLRNTIELVENAKFMEQKIKWALSGASTINIPTTGNEGSTLSVTKSGTTFIVDYAGGVVRLKSGAGDPIAITNSFVSVSSLSFEHFVFSQNTKGTLHITAELQNFAIPKPATTSIDFYVSIQ
jgi:type II secretory pathway pseudopilin PulG